MGSILYNTCGKFNTYVSLTRLHCEVSLHQLGSMSALINRDCHICSCLDNCTRNVLFVQISVLLQHKFILPYCNQQLQKRRKFSFLLAGMLMWCKCRSCRILDCGFYILLRSLWADEIMKWQNGRHLSSNVDVQNIWNKNFSVRLDIKYNWSCLGCWINERFYILSVLLSCAHVRSYSRKQTWHCLLCARILKETDWEIVLEHGFRQNTDYSCILFTNIRYYWNELHMFTLVYWERRLRDNIRKTNKKETRQHKCTVLISSKMSLTLILI